MNAISKVTGKVYNKDTAVYFKNALQSAKYVKAGAVLLDLILDYKEDRFIFVFSREDHDRLKGLWKDYVL